MPSSRSTMLDTLFVRIADAAAAQTLPRFRGDTPVTNKSANAFDPVTDADRDAETAIRKVINEVFPEDSILGEEHGLTEGTSGARWVIDPVDGTRAFISGIPVWTTLVGREDQGVPVAGMIDQPFLAERWCAVDGETSYVRDGIAAKARVSG